MPIFPPKPHTKRYKKRALKIIKKKQFACYINDRYTKNPLRSEHTPLCKFIPFTKNLHFLPKKLLTTCYEATFIYPLPGHSRNDNKSYRSRRKRWLNITVLILKKLVIARDSVQALQHDVTRGFNALKHHATDSPFRRIDEWVIRVFTDRF